MEDNGLYSSGAIRQRYLWHTGKIKKKAVDSLPPIKRRRGTGTEDNVPETTSIYRGGMGKGGGIPMTLLHNLLISFQKSLVLFFFNGKKSGLIFFLRREMEMTIDDFLFVMFLVFQIISVNRHLFRSKS